MEHATILRSELVSIDSITRHPENARRADVATLEASLREHGQYAPVVVHEQTGYILKGNNTHRVMAEKLGLTEINATFVSCTEAQARAILVVDNKSTDEASYDETALLSLLETLDADGLLAASGFNQTDLDDLTALLEEAVPEPEEMLGGGDTGEEPSAAPRVDVGSGMQAAKSLNELGAEYDARASRSMQLILPLKQFVWAVDQLGKIAAEFDVDNNADAVLQLISHHTGAEIPDAE